MHLSRLTLSNFRIFRKAEISFEDRITLLVGGNAQGKTSILEAIYLFATFFSPQTSNTRQMMNFSVLEEQQPVSRLVAHFQSNGKNHSMELRFIAESQEAGNVRIRKEILVDGIKKTAVRAIGFFNAVIFLPQMTALIERGPEERRKYLDQMLAQTDPLYARALVDFNRALARRNALLKILNEKGGDPSQLIHWDSLLAENGATLTKLRIECLRSLVISAARSHAGLSSQQEMVSAQYQSGIQELGKPINFEKISLIEIREHLTEFYRKCWRSDILRGLTLFGPHRDEVRFFINGIDAADYGSRGQIRSLVFALKIAEVEFIREKTGEHPVLLLDETFAELDPVRRENLFSVIKQSQQVILTTTDLEFFPKNYHEPCDIKSVHDGKIINHL